MAHVKTTLPALFVFGVIVAGAAVLPSFSAMAHDEQGGPTFEQRVGDHIEGHIAFLKVELKITPAQEALWDKVAAVMRADVVDFDRLPAQNAAKVQAQPTALQHLEERALYTALRAKCEQRFLDVFRPLYEQLTAAQRQVADELLGQRREEM